jgi:hypothetical protein
MPADAALADGGEAWHFSERWMELARVVTPASQSG